MTVGLVEVEDAVVDVGQVAEGFKSGSTVAGSELCVVDRGVRRLQDKVEGGRTGDVLGIGKGSSRDGCSGEGELHLVDRNGIADVGSCGCR